MKLTELKVGDYIKRKNHDSYFQLIEISGFNLLFEKISEPKEQGFRCKIKSYSNQFEFYEIVTSLPEKYLPF